MPNDASPVASHLALLVLFAAFVSIVFATLQREAPREQLRLGLLLFGGFLGSALLLGWLMYPLPW